MAGKGLCCAIAILHALAGLDLEALCRQQSLAGVNFEAVSRWVSFWDFILPATTEQMDRVQMFAVVILHPKVQFTKEIV